MSIARFLTAVKGNPDFLLATWTCSPALSGMKIVNLEVIFVMTFWISAKDWAWNLRIGEIIFTSQRNIPSSWLFGSWTLEPLDQQGVRSRLRSGITDLSRLTAHFVYTPSSGSLRNTLRCAASNARITSLSTRVRWTFLS